MDMPERGRKLKAEFIARRGFWPEEYEGLAALCPDFLEAHLASSVIATRSDVISPLLSEYIAIAIDVSTTHLFESGLRLHVRQALRLGATAKQIALVIQLVSSIGVQSQLVGLPILAQLTDRAALPPTPDQDALKQAFIARHPVWSPAHQALLQASPAYFAAQLALSGTVMDDDALSAKEKALILVAANGAVTHLQEDALRLSMEMALATGASAEEIVAVLRRVSSLGMHSCMFGFPILMSELARLEKNGEQQTEGR